MSEHNTPCRIGVVLTDENELRHPALRYLVLAINAQQSLFQFEFYNIQNSDPLLSRLTRVNSPAQRIEIRDTELPEFVDRVKLALAKRVMDFELAEEPPERFVVICLSRFDDNYYSTRNGGGSIIALGNCDEYMAPPSLFEFIQVLLIREAVAALCPSLSGSVHLGNKGCLMDFTEMMSEVHHKALLAFICDFCASRMRSDSRPGLAETIAGLLNRDWLGSPEDPRTPAGIAANLGYNLFTTKGLRPTRTESFLATMQQESAKQIIGITSSTIGTILIAVIALVLGLKIGN